MPSLLELGLTSASAPGATFSLNSHIARIATKN